MYTMYSQHSYSTLPLPIPYRPQHHTLPPQQLQLYVILLSPTESSQYRGIGSSSGTWVTYGGATSLKNTDSLVVISFQ